MLPGKVKKNGVLLFFLLVFLTISGCGKAPQLFGVTITWTEGGVVEEKVNGEWVEPVLERNVESDTSIQLRAIADLDYIFSGWEVQGADHGDPKEGEITLTNFSSGALIKANFDKGVLVHNAEELEDALDLQDDYDVIRFGANITTEVNYDIILSSDGLIFDLNGYKLLVEPDFDFIVSGDNITLEGSEVELQGEGYILIEGYDIIIKGLTIITEDQDFYIETGGEVSLTIIDSDFSLGEGNFYLDAYNMENIEIFLTISGSSFSAKDFYILSYTDKENIKTYINISDGSEFKLQNQFLIDPYAQSGGELEMFISNSDVNLENGQFWVYADGSEQKINVKLTNSNLRIPQSNFTLKGTGNDGEIYYEIKNCLIEVQNQFLYETNGNNDISTLKIEGSTIELGENPFFIDADNPTVDLAVEIINSEFSLNDNEFKIVSPEGQSDVKIKNSSFENGSIFRIEAKTSLLETILFDTISSLSFLKDAVLNVVDFVQISALAIGSNATLEIYDAYDDGVPIDEPGDLGNAIGIIFLELNSEIIVYWEGDVVETIP